MNRTLNNELFLFRFIGSFLIQIIIMNLLISIIGDSYDIIKAKERVANNRERTIIL